MRCYVRALSVAATLFYRHYAWPFECHEARKHLQQEDRQQQDLERFQEYLNMEKNYAAKDCHDSPSPSPRKMKCDPLYIP